MWGSIRLQGEEGTGASAGSTQGCVGGPWSLGTTGPLLGHCCAVLSGLGPPDALDHHWWLLKPVFPAPLELSSSDSLAQRLQDGRQCPLLHAGSSPGHGPPAPHVWHLQDYCRETKEGDQMSAHCGICPGTVYDTEPASPAESAA